MGRKKVDLEVGIPIILGKIETVYMSKYFGMKEIVHNILEPNEGKGVGGGK